MSFNKLAKQLLPTHFFSNLSTISTKTLIQMNNVWASYDAENYSLKEITLSIERGTNYAIVGQSGYGKSTLLKLINGMMIPSKGQIKTPFSAKGTCNPRRRGCPLSNSPSPAISGLVKNIT